MSEHKTEASKVGRKKRKPTKVAGSKRKYKDVSKGKNQNEVDLEDFRIKKIEIMRDMLLEMKAKREKCVKELLYLEDCGKILDFQPNSREITEKYSEYIQRFHPQQFFVIDEDDIQTFNNSEEIETLKSVQIQEEEEEDTTSDIEETLVITDGEDPSTLLNSSSSSLTHFNPYKTFFPLSSSSGTLPNNNYNNYITITPPTSPSKTSSFSPTFSPSLSPKQLSFSPQLNLSSSSSAIYLPDYDVVEKANKDAEVYKKVAEYKKNLMWSLETLPRLQDPTHFYVNDDNYKNTKMKVNSTLNNNVMSHWDFLLNEMTAVSNIFKKERRRKYLLGQKIARMCKKKAAFELQKDSKKEKQKQMKIRKVASNIAKHVKKFWSDIDKIVKKNQELQKEEKLQEEREKHLELLVDQTEKISSLLASDLQSTPQKKTKKKGKDVDMEDEEEMECDPSDSETDDDEFDPSREPGDAESEVASGDQNEEKPDTLKKQNRKDIITLAAEAASRAQPTGTTLQTSTVKTEVPFLLKNSLREYQHIGLDWLVSMYDRKLNGILADEMGLGKTIMTISLIAHLACDKELWGPHLIVVPTSVMLNWEKEFKRWCPALKVMTYYGNQKERKLKRVGWSKRNSFHVCITSYNLITKDKPVFMRKNWGYMILDEAQNIKNFQSQRWQVLLGFKAKRRLLLTGTPLQNNLMELWSLMHFLMPKIFASHSEFRDWFCNPMNNLIENNNSSFGNFSNLNSSANSQIISRLHGVLRPFILRRMKKDVEKQLPNKYEHVIPCALAKKQRYLYDEFISRSNTKETLISGNYLSILNIIMQLRKVCNHPDLFEERAIESPFFLPPLEFTTSHRVVDIIEKDSDRRVNLEFLNLKGRNYSLCSCLESVIMEEITPSSSDFDNVFAENDANTEDTQSDRPLTMSSSSSSLPSNIVITLNDSDTILPSPISIPSFDHHHHNLTQSVTGSIGNFERQEPQPTIIPAISPSVSALFPIQYTPQPTKKYQRKKRKLKFDDDEELNYFYNLYYNRNDVDEYDYSIEVIDNTDLSSLSSSLQNVSQLQLPNTTIDLSSDSLQNNSTNNDNIITTEESMFIDDTTQFPILKEEPLSLPSPLFSSLLPPSSIVSPLSLPTPSTLFISPINFSLPPPSSTSSSSSTLNSGIQHTEILNMENPSLGLIDAKNSDNEKGTEFEVNSEIEEKRGEGGDDDDKTHICIKVRRSKKIQKSNISVPKTHKSSTPKYKLKAMLNNNNNSNSNNINSISGQKKKKKKRKRKYDDDDDDDDFLGDDDDDDDDFHKYSTANPNNPNYHLHQNLHQHLHHHHHHHSASSSTTTPTTTTSTSSTTTLGTPSMQNKVPKKHVSYIYDLSLLQNYKILATERKRTETNELRSRLYHINCSRCCSKRGFLCASLLRLLDIPTTMQQLNAQSNDPKQYMNYSSQLLSMITTIEDLLERFQLYFERFLCPWKVMTSSVKFYSSSLDPSYLSSRSNYENRMDDQLKILKSTFRVPMICKQLSFPDKRLIQYDCGKLQTLAVLLRDLKRDNHRVLIFTQMTRMLDILERFLNIHGYKYMRLDGATKPEQRQMLMDRFNMDPKIFVFILSTRSGGFGINLVGADTVVFYDSDWNPAMDSQAQDRCHRIGQTREVNIYRLISEKTIEENILKKAKQKRLLDQLAIEGGNFTTEFFQNISNNSSNNNSNNNNNIMSENNIRNLLFDSSDLSSIVNSINASEGNGNISINNNNNGQINISNEEMERAMEAVEEESDVAAMKIAKSELQLEAAEFADDKPQFSLTPIQRYAFKLMDTGGLPYLLTGQLIPKANSETSEQIDDEDDDGDDNTSAEEASSDEDEEVDSSNDSDDNGEDDNDDNDDDLEDNNKDDSD